MNGRRRARAIFTLALAGAAAAAGATAASAGSAQRAAPASITVWLSGTYAGATPGSAYRQWVDGIKARYEARYPGSKVTFKLTPINNDQFTAQIAAAFASRRVPDAMLVYSGGYTTPYMESSLQRLNDRIDGDKGMYGSLTAWDLSCLKLDCKGGQGDIYGVPSDQGTYALFYNKALFAKAGVKAPPRTYAELLALCPKFKKAGIVPLAYGDRDGYSTDNW